MLNLISQGVSLGFSAGAIPGPFQSYLISTTLSLGWRKSLIVILTPLISDGPIILLAVVLLKGFSPELIRIIQLVGGVYLLWLAYSAWKRLRNRATLTEEAPTQRRTLGQGLLMNWLNPNPYIFWATITGPLLVGALEVSIWQGIAFLLAFYITFVGFLAIYVAIFDRLRGLDDRITQGIFYIALAVLVIFGFSLIGQGLNIL